MTNRKEAELTWHAGHSDSVRVTAGLSVAPALDVQGIVSSLSTDKERQVKLCEVAYEAVRNEYLRIEAAIQDPYKGSASAFAQPWQS